MAQHRRGDRVTTAALSFHEPPRTPSRCRAGLHSWAPNFTIISRTTPARYYFRHCGAAIAFRRLRQHLFTAYATIHCAPFDAILEESR